MRKDVGTGKQQRAFDFFKVRTLKNFANAVCIALALSAAGCDRMITSRSSQVIKDAEAKAADGNYPRAITLYESALDGSDKSADIHYRLALLYDDKVKDPLNALHHFKRYLVLAPNGPHAAEVKTFMKRAEVDLQTSLSGDSIVSRSEAARLRNENLGLQRRLEEQGTRAPDKTRDAKTGKAAGKNAHKSRTYVVRDGDTLASISRKHYKSSHHWKQILEANKDTLDSPAKLKPGQTLTLP